MGQETKKERILEMAVHDPFLRIEEIASQAGTTTRYVRTALSEAGLSLTHLRKTYARRMQKELGRNVQETGLTQIEEELVSGGLQVSRLQDPEVASLLGMEPEAELLKVSRVSRRQGSGYCVIEVVASGDLQVSAKLLDDDQPLRRGLGLDDEDTRCIRSQLDLASADDYLAGSLRVSYGDPLLRSRAVLIAGGRTFLQTHYFDANRVSFQMEAENLGRLRVVERFS